MKIALAYFFSFLLLLLMIEGCSSDNSRFIVDSPVTISLQITPSNISVPKETTGDYTAVAYYSDGTFEDVSTQVIWNSSDTAVVAFNTSTPNHAEALSPGTSFISTSLNGVDSNIAKVEVTNVTLDHLDIDPIVKSVANGVEVKYRAIGYFSDGSHYNLTLFSTFSSSNTAVATIQSNTLFKSGLASTLSTGSTNITASFRATTSNTATLTVTAETVTSLQVTPALISAPVGTKDYYTAVAFYTDGSSHDVSAQANWTSSNTASVSIVASGTNAGLADALASGNSNIQASYDAMISNTAQVSVIGKTLSQIQLVPATPTSIALGNNQQYQVWAYYDDSTSKDVTLDSTFSIEDTSIATIDTIGENKGLANGVGIGSTYVLASFQGSNDRVSLTVTAPILNSIQVTPADVSVPTGTQDRFTAIAFYSDNTSLDVSDRTTWLSDTPAVVSIISSGSSGGLATALTAGTANITASLDGITSNIALVTVTGKTIDNIQITPNNRSYAVGVTAQYHVTVIYTDSSIKDVTEFSQIESFDTSIATFDTNNLMTAVGIGDVELSAVYEGVTSEREFLHVTAPTLTSIQVTPAALTVPKGSFGRYTAVAYYSDNTHEDITKQATWISGNTDILKVVASGFEGGLAYAYGTGSTTLTANHNGIRSNIAKIEVIAPLLTSVEIIAYDIEFPKGNTVYYDAIAHYSDLTSEDITEEAVWSSSDTTVATVNEGVVYGVSVGTSNISIDYESQTDIQAISVTAPALTGLVITPATHTMDIGLSQSYLATASFADGTTKDVTKDVTWISSDLDVAKIDNTFSKGEATALAAGPTNINAAYQGAIVGNTASLTVLAASVTLDTIVVTPANQTVTVGSYVTYTATGNFSDASSKDITQDVTWQSSSTSIATIETVGELKGVAQAISSGSTTISASLDLISGSTSLNISGDCGPSKPNSIAISLDPETIPVGEKRQLHLTGTWPAACTREITYDPAAVWNSSDDNIVSMASKGGEAFGHKTGSVTVTAKYRGLTETSIANVP